MILVLRGHSNGLDQSRTIPAISVVLAGAQAVAPAVALVGVEELPEDIGV